MPKTHETGSVGFLKKLSSSNYVSNILFSQSKLHFHNEDSLVAIRFLILFFLEELALQCSLDERGIPRGPKIILMGQTGVGKSTLGNRY